MSSSRCNRQSPVTSCSPSPPYDPYIPATTRPEKPRLVLIDGHSLIYRSFLVFQGSKTSKAVEFTIRKTGEVVTGVYGFTSTFLSILDQLKPTHAAIALDAPGATFRHEKDASYKATRAAMAVSCRMKAAQRGRDAADRDGRLFRRRLTAAPASDTADSRHACHGSVRPRRQ